MTPASTVTTSTSPAVIFPSHGDYESSTDPGPDESKIKAVPQKQFATTPSSLTSSDPFNKKVVFRPNLAAHDPNQEEDDCDVAELVKRGDL